MGTKNQIKEILFKYHFGYKAKKYPVLAKIPLLQRLIYGNSYRLVSKDQYYETVLSLVGLRPTRSIQEYVEEIRDNNELRMAYEIAKSKGLVPPQRLPYDQRITEYESRIVHNYAFVREFRPSVMVETGTAQGYMTSWMLAALEKNNHGKLISIDLPPTVGEFAMNFTLKADEVGCFIPPEYHHRWEHILGDAKLHLPKVMADNDVDIFIHDSLHTRTHMLYEFAVAKALMKPGRVIMTDDILWNNSFFEFLKSNHLHGVSSVENPNIGFTVNQFDKYELDIGVDPIRN
jgi:hypothetical protein